jgi:hypothetical protein
LPILHKSGLRLGDNTTDDQPQSVGQNFCQNLVEASHKRDGPKIIQTLRAIHLRDKSDKSGIIPLYPNIDVVFESIQTL